MSYARPIETGSYIYSDGNYLHINLIKVPEDDINIFLYKLYTTRRDEFNNRLEKGKSLIEQNKLDKDDNI